MDNGEGIDYKWGAGWVEWGKGGKSATTNSMNNKLFF